MSRVRSRQPPPAGRARAARALRGAGARAAAAAAVRGRRPWLDRPRGQEHAAADGATVVRWAADAAAAARGARDRFAAGDGRALAFAVRFLVFEFLEPADDLAPVAEVQLKAAAGDRPTNALTKTSDARSSMGGGKTTVVSPRVVPVAPRVARAVQDRAIPCWLESSRPEERGDRRDERDADAATPEQPPDAAAGDRRQGDALLEDASPKVALTLSIKRRERGLLNAVPTSRALFLHPRGDRAAIDRLGGDRFGPPKPLALGGRAQPRHRRSRRRCGRGGGRRTAELEAAARCTRTKDASSRSPSDVNLATGSSAGRWTWPLRRRDQWARARVPRSRRRRPGDRKLARELEAAGIRRRALKNGERFAIAGTRHASRARAYDVMAASSSRTEFPGVPRRAPTTACSSSPPPPAPPPPAGHDPPPFGIPACRNGRPRRLARRQGALHPLARETLIVQLAQAN